MNRLLSLIGSVVLLICAPLAKAYIIEDVITFNRAITAPLAWTHDLTRYGYVPGTSYTQLSLILELRDLQDYPDKDVLDRPFFMINQGPGRTFGRVLMEDIDASDVMFVDPTGMVRPGLTILEGEVWIGRAILRANIPDPLEVPEPGSLGLLAMGLLLMVARLRRKNL